jgi:hypothetical protein
VKDEMKNNEKPHTHTEELRKVSIDLEEDQIEALEELAGEYRKRLGQEWDLGAVVRLAVGDFLTKLGKMS